MKRVPLNLLAATAIAVAAPVWAVSLPAAGPTPTPPDSSFSQAALSPVDNWTAGSAALVPLMAADAQANQAAAIEEPANDAGGATTPPIDDVAFVKQATESGRKEVNSAREALAQLTRPDLKRFAEMLVSDHTGANARLAKLADDKGWPVPATPPSGPPPSGAASGDFDSKWTAEMIAGHERSVALYRAQATRGEDRELRKFARDTLPTIERHLADLRRMQK